GDILYLESLHNDNLVHHDPSILAMSVAFILEGFIDEPPLEENDELFDLEPKNDDWKKILYDAPILMTEDKVFDPRIHDQNFSLTYVSLPFTDRHYLIFTYVVQIFIPHFTYPVVSPFLLSSESEDTIFDLGIFVFIFLIGVELSYALMLIPTQ
nr:hypothetical protein [Tanacetum cinerariifolium]GEZ71476.1 hypothetical protein [Tanacetum cinerariifolium]GFA72394.1 hypothetical protein [Tanacetum cinerariifolium]